MTFDELVTAFSIGWLDEQIAVDALLDGEKSTWCSSVSLKFKNLFGWRFFNLYSYSDNGHPG
jgi:hypothetical protein